MSVAKKKIAGKVKVTRHLRKTKSGVAVVRQHNRFKNPKGGLTPAGRKFFGVKKGVTNYDKASVPDKKRWISWASRFYGQQNLPPLEKPNGEPTRLALTANAWGEPVPKTVSEARKIYQKAQKRKQQLLNQEKW